MTRWTRHTVKEITDIREPYFPPIDWETVADSGGGRIDGEDLPPPVAEKPKDPRTRPPIGCVVTGPTYTP